MKLRLSALAACLLLTATAAQADNYPFKDGKGILQNFASILVGAIHHQKIVIEGLFSGAPKPVAVDTNGNVGVTCASGCSGATVKATAAAPTYVEGSTTNPLSTDLSGNLRIGGTISASSVTKSTAADPTYTEGVTTNQISVDLGGYARSLAKQTGTWNITNVSGTVSLPTGASTSANQASIIGTKAAGTAATNSVLTGGAFNTSLPTLTNGQQASIQLDSSARQIMVCASGCSGGTQFAEDAAHASGDPGTFALVVRSDTAASTAGTTGDYTAMITDATGHLWTHGVAVASDFADGWDVTQGAKGDTAWTSGSGSVIALLKTLATAALDTTTPSPMKIDQTTPGTTDSVSVKASELHKGELGGNAITVQVAQTVTAAAYTSGNAVGGLMTVANAARVSAASGSPGTSGLVQSIIVGSKSAQTTQIDIFLFNANPSASTCTDKTAFVLNSADFDKVIGVAHVTDWTAGNTASVGQAQNLAIPYALTSATSMFACAITRATPTYGSTSDISIGYRFLRN